MDLFVLFLLVIGICHGKAIKPKKVAILGGGAASCSAALALTDQPGWKERFDITIYQLGWRLGGKARSGRNKNYGQRSEGVTLHHFSSIYIETKRVIRSVYKELNRPEGAPLRTFEEAFVSIALRTEQEKDCEIDRECFSMDYLFDKLTGTLLWMTKKMMIKKLGIDYAINEEHFKPDSIHLQFEVTSVQAFLKKIFPTVKNNSLTQEYLSMIDTTATIIIGFMEDNLIERGLYTINHLDLRQWLKKHGASETTINSRFVLAHYDELISYFNGDMQKPDMEAGTALQVYLPHFFCCEDITVWHHEAGLGDAMFAPIYEILKRRGVHFKFFHKVEGLVLNTGNSKFVKQIRITKQIDLINEEYNPLIDVKGLPSWPNEPKYEEITQLEADLLQKYDIDLESFWTNWSGVYEENFGHPIPEVVLKRGEDFDIIVYGIPVGSLPFLCGELLEKSPSLKKVSEHIGKVPSLQFQLWGTLDLEDWKKELYVHRLTDPMQRQAVYGIADNDDILKTENWETIGLKPEQLLYIIFNQHVVGIPPSNDTLFPHEQMEKVKRSSIHEIQEILKGISPNSFQDGVFNWTVLTDPMNRTGVERFDSQYLRLNLNPSDLFTQILTNTSQYRITTDGAGFDNIYFTGDWIQNGINYGSIEGAITSGLLTSKAISGYPRQIFWEKCIAKKK